MPTDTPLIIGQLNTATRTNPTTPAPETSLSRDDGAARTVLVARNLNMGNGIRGEAVHYTGVDGRSSTSVGVYGASSVSTGVYGVSGTGGPGAPGTSTGTGVEGYSPSGTGVQGVSRTGGTGVDGRSTSGFGVSGYSGPGPGVRGFSDDYYGVFGTSNSESGVGVAGIGPRGGIGVSGSSDTAPGVRGYSGGTGVQGVSTSGIGVSGESNHDDGVRGTSISRPGVRGISDSSYAVVGVSDTNIGVYGYSRNPSRDARKVAGYFDGGIIVTARPGQEFGDAIFEKDVEVDGTLTVKGFLSKQGGGFRIDHPRDPANKYLNHSFVESSEMKNVYDGVAQLDEEGSTWVELPEWFEALNGDFRYQLTAVGGAAPNLHVAEEVSENHFKIAGGEEGLKVCWQVTGSRKDPWAAANPFEVEQEKPEEHRGRYLEPSLYDAPEEQRVMMGPLGVEEEQRPPEPSGIDFARLEEEHRRQLDELRRQEEDHRRDTEELRRRMEERQEEAPPEST